jgi:hypothetical protein
MLVFSTVDARPSPESMKFPVFSLLAGNFGFRDGFARDCLLQRRVICEPDFLDLAQEPPATSSCNARVRDAPPSATLRKLGRRGQHAVRLQRSRHPEFPRLLCLMEFGSRA